MKLPILKSREVVSILFKARFIKKRQTGSHLIFLNPDTGKIVPVPIHVKDIKKGLLKAIIKEADLTEEEFLKIFRK